MDHHHHDDHEHDHQIAFDTPEMAARTERDGEVLAGLTGAAIDAVANVAHRDRLDVRRVVDLGSGPGVAAVALAERFGAARVVAVDGSAAMLERAVARATRLGVATRVDAEPADLTGDLARFGPADVVWVSMALHHVGDELDALRRIGAILRNGGLLALVERAGPVRVVPDGSDPAWAGLWERVDEGWDSWFAAMRAALPGATESSDYPAMLTTAGFAVVVDQVLTVEVAAPLDDAAQEFARDQLAFARSRLGAHLDDADLAALDALLDTDRPDATIRASRHLYVARSADA